MENEISCKRLNWMDTIKGIGILLVIIGHCCTGVIIDYMYMFHMPLFFIISGFLWNHEKYNKMSLKRFVIIKWQSLIIPYFKIAGVCFLLFGVVLCYHRYGFCYLYLETLLKYIYGITIYSKGTSEWLPLCYPLWFMTCLFCMEVLIKIFINSVIFKMFIIGSGIIGYTLSYGGKLPWNIDTCLTAIPLFYIGLICKKYWKIISKPYYLFVLVPITIIIFAYGIKGVDFNFNSYTNLLSVYIQSSIITITLFSLIKNYYMLLPSSITIIFSPFILWGQNTIFIMGYHCALIEFLKRIPGCHYNWNLVFIVILLCTILIIIKNRNKVLSYLLS